MTCSQYTQVWLIGCATDRNAVLLKNISLWLDVTGRQLALSSLQQEEISESHKQKYLILVDAQELTYQTFEHYLGFMLEKIHACSIILFNVCKHSELEGTVRWPRVDAVLFKKKNSTQIMRAVKRVVQGKTQIPNSIITDYFLKTRSIPFTYRSRQTFTDRELQILMQIAKGHSNKMIAYSLNVSSHTIKAQIYGLFRKIKVSNRVQAVMWAKQNAYL